MSLERFAEWVERFAFLLTLTGHDASLPGAAAPDDYDGGVDC